MYNYKYICNFNVNVKFVDMPRRSKATTEGRKNPNASNNQNGDLVHMKQMDGNQPIYGTDAAIYKKKSIEELATIGLTMREVELIKNVDLTLPRNRIDYERGQALASAILGDQLMVNARCGDTAAIKWLETSRFNKSQALHILHQRRLTAEVEDKEAEWTKQKKRNAESAELDAFLSGALNSKVQAYSANSSDIDSLIKADKQLNGFEEDPADFID